MFRGGIAFLFWINLWYQQFNVICWNFNGFFQRSIFSVESTCQPFGKIQPERLETQNLLEALNQWKFVGQHPKMDPTIWILQVVALISIIFTGSQLYSQFYRLWHWIPQEVFYNYIYNSEVALISMLIINVFSCGLLPGFQRNTRIFCINLCWCGNPCQRNNCICRCYWRKATPKHIQYLQYVIYTGTCLSSISWAEQPSKNKAQIKKKQSSFEESICIFIPQY